MLQVRCELIRAHPRNAAKGDDHILQDAARHDLRINKHVHAIFQYLHHEWPQDVRRCGNGELSQAPARVIAHRLRFVGQALGAEVERRQAGELRRHGLQMTGARAGEITEQPEPALPHVGVLILAGFHQQLRDGTAVHQRLHGGAYALRDAAQKVEGTHDEVLVVSDGCRLASLQRVFCLKLDADYAHTPAEQWPELTPQTAETQNSIQKTQ